jgi:predicted membrane-bound spermidine synthase
MRSPLGRVALLLFGSGFCALVYQTAWLRMLRLVFGASTAASAAVLAIFMAGLGFGGLLLGRAADRRPDPLLLYARLETGIAIAAGLSPWLILLVQRAYVGLGGSATLGAAGGAAVRLVLSAIVLGFPTFLMGGTLPAVSRAVERSGDAGRRSVGLLYAVNTLGAVLGALVTTFAAVELLGLQRTIWVAALLNLLVAIWARRQAEILAAATAAAGTGDPETGETTVDAPRPALLPLHPLEIDEETGQPAARSAALLVPPAAALVGFAFLLMELVWYRMLAPLLGGSSYTFGLILAVALLGIGAGGLIYAAGPQLRRPTLASFAATCALEALALAVPLALGDRIAVLAAVLRPLGGVGFFPLVVGWTIVTLIVVLPAAVVSGYQFPLLIALLGGGRRRVGREVGITYAANTLGAIVGSIAGGFGLLPLMTAPGVWRLAVLLLVGLAGVAVAAGGLGGWRHGGWRRILAPLAVAAAAGLLCAAPGPSAFWRHSPIGAGRVSGVWSGPNQIRATIDERQREVVWERDGVESSVALDIGEETSFLVNGKADGSSRADAPTQVMGGLVGSLLHPNPKRALVIGLGTGSTAGWLAAVPSIERVDVVELEPSVIHVAEVLGAVNHDALRNPKVHLIVGDGREVLLTSSQSYDIIFSEPSNPYRAGISSLFTRDFYQAVRRRLRPGGMLLQWLQGYELDAGVVATVYATLGEVFPAVESWEINAGDLLLVASPEPLDHDLNRVRERVGQSPYREALAQTWAVGGAEGFYSGYLASPAFGRAMRQRPGTWINTDDHPVLEFGFARNLGRQGLFKVSEIVALAQRRHEERPALRNGTLDWAKVVELNQSRQVFWREPLLARPEKVRDPALEQRMEAREAYSRGSLAEACEDWLEQPAPPRSRLDLLLLAECLAETGDPRTPKIVGLLGTRPAEPELVLALWDQVGKRPAEAGHHLAAAFRACRRDAWTHVALLERGLRLAARVARADRGAAAELLDATAEPFAAGLLDTTRLRLRVDLARALGGAHGGACVPVLAPFEPHVLWDESFLTFRAQCYAQAKHPLARRALDDLEDYLDQAPPRLDTGIPPASP